jgi:polyhydroxyalkanoate synthase
VAGESIDLERISQPIYAVAAADDHIAPWKQAYRINNFVSGSRRFVLSSSGHILGIVNPPVTPPKRQFWVAEAVRHESADQWQSRAENHQGSWWSDWISWLRPYSGTLGPPPDIANAKFPIVGEAPGTYVLET